MKKAIMMDQKDNVGTALESFGQGEKVEIVSLTKEVLRQVTVNEAIALGHKLALENIQKGASVIKYGEIIGRATKDILAAEYVHIHNVESVYDRF